MLKALNAVLLYEIILFLRSEERYRRDLIKISEAGKRTGY
jgi:hypothetical protein